MSGGESERGSEGLRSSNDRDNHRHASVRTASSRSDSIPALTDNSSRAGARERSPRGSRASDANSGEESYKPVRRRNSSRASSPLPISDRRGFEDESRRSQRALMDDRATADTRMVAFDDGDEFFESNLGELMPDEDMTTESLVHKQQGNGHCGPTGADSSSALSGVPQAFRPSAVNTVASQHNLDHSVTAQMLVANDQRAVTFHQENHGFSQSDVTAEVERQRLHTEQLAEARFAERTTASAAAQQQEIAQWKMSSADTERALSDVTEKLDEAIRTIAALREEITALQVDAANEEKETIKREKEWTEDKEDKEATSERKLTTYKQAAERKASRSASRAV